jgi:hypothetical protein
MKLRSSPVLGFVCMGLVLAMDTDVDCKDLASGGLLDAMWFSAAVAVSDANTRDLIAENNDEIAGQQQPGAPGAPGINCWDLNGDGVNDADEDVNGDGLWDALDCQGSAGQDGVDGSDGQNGLDGQDGQNGGDGEDLTGVIARGWIPGADYDAFPLEVGAVYVSPDGAAVGILSAYRPEPEAGDPNFPTPGEYHVRVALPQRDEAYTRSEIVVLISVEARRMQSDPGPLYQLFGYWQILPDILDGDVILGDVLELKIMVKAGSVPSMFPADGNFSIVVMVP